MNDSPELDKFREDGGAYVLGALSLQERHQFELHLRDCARCARAVRELAGLPGLLATVPQAVAEAEPAGPAPDTLLPWLIRQVRRRQRRRRWLTAVAAAAVAAVLSVGGLTLVAVQSTGTTGARSPSAATETHTGPARSMTVLAPTGMRASLSLQHVTWGTRLELRCTYPASTAPTGVTWSAGRGGEQPKYQLPTYQLVLRSTIDKTQRVATWRAVPGKTITLTGVTSWSPADIADVQVQTASGQPLLGLIG